jgi:hypothetical protein
MSRADEIWDRLGCGELFSNQKIDQANHQGLYKTHKEVEAVFFD